MAQASPLLAPTGAQIDQYTGAITAAPDTLVENNIEYLDFGTTAAAANSVAKAVRIQYPATFDDSIYTQLRFWAANQAPLTGHSWLTEISNVATMPAVALTDPLTIGVPLPKNGLSSIIRPANGAASAGPDLYIPADKQQKHILLQLQLAAGATPYNQQSSQYAPPILFAEAARTDYASATGDGPTVDLIHYAYQLCEGHHFAYSSIDAFIELLDEPAQAGVWHYLEDIKDDSVTHSSTNDVTEWKKFKPEVTVQQARSAASASVTFNLGQWNPLLMALCDQNSAYRDASSRDIVNELGAASSMVRYCKLIFRHRLQGLGMVTVEYPRVVLTCGDYTPGAADFAEMNITANAQIGCTQKRVLRRFRTTDTPIDVITLPLVAATTA